MENKLIKISICFCLLIQFKFGFAQGNPGFLGKKIAIGYSSQFCLLRSDNIISPPENASLGQILTNHDFNVEYATNKYKSIAFHLGYQKVPVVKSNDYYGNDPAIVQTINLGSGPEQVRFLKEGVTDFRMLALGLKFTSYYKNKTISSPIGLGVYFRIDAYFNKALNNYYKYTCNEYSLSELQKATALKKLDKSYDDTKTNGLSLGTGIESKYPITQSIYFRLNGEFNVTLNVLKVLTDTGEYSSTVSAEEDLKNTSKSLPDFRNMFLVGMGIGMIL